MDTGRIRSRDYEHLAKREHNVRSLRRTCLAADSATVPGEHRPESRDGRRVNGKEVTSVKTHTESNSSESHQAHGDSDSAQCKAKGGESKVNFEKARLSQADAGHEVQRDNVPEAEIERTPLTH